MLRNTLLSVVLFLVCFSNAACSFLVPKQETLSIVASDSSALIYVDGQRVGKGQASVSVRRNRSHAVTATTPDGRSAGATVGTDISGIGYLDLIGGIFLFFPALIGIAAPGFRTLESDTVTLTLDDPR